MAKRNVTPRRSTTAPSTYEIGMKGTVDITGLETANPTYTRAGTAKNPLGDILDAIGALGKGMSSYVSGLSLIHI